MRRIFSVLIFSVLLFFHGVGVSHGQTPLGNTAPLFSAADTDGKMYRLETLKEKPMVILYFFDATSLPSQEGLFYMEELLSKYENTDMTVWAITRSKKAKVLDFVEKNDFGFPILLDDSKVSDLYQARLVLPTICILGPDLKMLDFFQGGGKATEVMLVRLAQRNLQRKKTKVAKAISEKVIRKNPRNSAAKAVKGYAALKEGNVDEAEKVFAEVSKEKGKGEILGKEGLAAVYVKKGKHEKALSIASEIEKKAPERPLAHVVKGDILFARNKKKDAEAAFKRAASKEEAEPLHKAVALNRLGRFKASAGNYSAAQQLYEQAVEIDPYYIEATSNKGMAYEKDGKYDKALEAYQQAIKVGGSDMFTAVLAKRAQRMLAIEKNAKERERIQQLVKDLAERYRSQQSFWKKPEDTWTSRPLILSFVDFQEQGGLSEREGLSTVITTRLAEELNASGRVRVVERVVMERLLEELNLGSSELADPETALRLGKVLAAKLLGTGSIYFLPEGPILNMRLIDTETSGIAGVYNRETNSDANLEKDLRRLNRDILKTIVQKYPLKGYVVQVKGRRVIINLGASHGVVLGTRFEVLKEQEPIKYKGKVLRASPKAVAEIEIETVEQDFSYAQIIQKDQNFNKDDKVMEKVTESKANL